MQIDCSIDKEGRSGGHGSSKSLPWRRSEVGGGRERGLDSCTEVIRIVHVCFRSCGLIKRYSASI